MSNAEKVAECAGNACVGAFALMLGDPTGGAVAVATSFTGLALIAQKRLGAKRDTVAGHAAAAARTAVESCREFAEADAERIAGLLSDADIAPLSPEDLIAVVQGTETYRLAAPLAGVLHARVRFDGDSAATIAVVRIALQSAMSACCRDSAFKDDLQTLLMMKSVRQSDAMMAMLTEMRGSRENAERELARREGLVIGLLRPIALNVPDWDTAMHEVERAINIAADLERRAAMPSNLGDQVGAVLQRMAEQNAQGDLDGAAMTVDDALAEIEAEKARLMNAAIEQHILRRDADSVAKRLWARRQLELSDGDDRFDLLQQLQDDWYVSGRDKGLNFDLEVSIRLAELSHIIAQTGDQLGAASNDLGISLNALGERESGTDRLKEAVGAYRDALTERTRDRVPLDWAATQNNLGNALAILGQRETGTDRLEEAVAAFRDALTEWTRDRVPLQWATTQNNLGNALQTLGQRETGTDRLEQAVAAFRDALTERTRDRVPLEWAMTQNNLGNALAILGQRETGTDRLEEAVAAFRDALTEWTRDRVPLQWAATQNNLGNALAILGQRETGTERLEQAVAAHQGALTEWTRDRVPLQWAMTQNNLGGVEVALFDKTGDPARLDAAEGHFRAALEVFEAAGADHYVGEVQKGLDAVAQRRGQA